MSEGVVILSGEDFYTIPQIACEGEVVKGDAGSWIVDEGERVAADAIVVGSNAHGLLAR